MCVPRGPKLLPLPGREGLKIKHLGVQRGAMFAVMSAHLGGETSNSAIALVRMQRLTIELASRIMEKEGEDYVQTILSRRDEHRDA